MAEVGETLASPSGVLNSVKPTPAVAWCLQEPGVPRFPSPVTGSSVLEKPVSLTKTFLSLLGSPETWRNSAQQD